MNTAAAGTPMPGMEVRTSCQDLIKRVGLQQGLNLGGDVRSLGVQGDELAGQVGQDDAGGVGACHHHGLGSQGVDDGVRPGGVASGSVGLEVGVHSRSPGLAQRGGGGPGGDDFQDGAQPPATGL